MTTINQALDTLRNAGIALTMTTEYSTDYFYIGGKRVITVEIPLETPLDKEIESSEYYKFSKGYKIPEVREIRYNGPATIVFWEDNTKTVVKMQPDELYYDPDKAFAMAVCKKLFGNKFNRHLTKAQKAFEKSCEEKYENRVDEFVRRMTDVNKRFDEFVRRMTDVNKR